MYLLGVGTSSDVSIKISTSTITMVPSGYNQLQFPKEALPESLPLQHIVLTLLVTHTRDYDHATLLITSSRR